MQPSKYLVTVLLFSLAVVGTGLFATAVHTQYGVDMNSSFSNSYNKISEIQNLSYDIKETIIPESGDVEEGDGSQQDADVDFYQYLKGGFTALKLATKSLTTVKTMASDIQKELGINPIFFNAFVAILIIVIIFGILTIVMKART